MLTERLSTALAIAVRAHDGQVRKGTSIPYLAHPMGVASLALEYGADEDQACAALLHDAIEDGGADYEAVIRQAMGDHVTALVLGCTDGVPDAEGRKPPWRERKEGYLAHLAAAPDEVLLVSGADKLHNARAILSDMQRVGDKVFERFTASKDQTLWYYASLAALLERRGAPMAADLKKAVQDMQGAGE
jgi:(p)ppGpp synthase/HD superfamily hydrolase